MPNLLGPIEGTPYVGGTAKGLVALDATGLQRTSADLAWDTTEGLAVGKTIYQSAEIEHTPTGTTQAIDWNTGNSHYLDLRSTDGPVTISFVDPAGPCRLVVRIQQPGVAVDLTWPSSIVWDASGEPDWTDDDGTTRWLVLAFDGVNYWAQVTNTYNTPADPLSDTIVLTCDQILVGPVTVAWSSFNEAAGATLKDGGAYPSPPGPFTENVA